MTRENPNDLRHARTWTSAAVIAVLALAGSLMAGAAFADEEADGEPTPVVHATVDEAALEALAALREDRSPAMRGRFRVGRILAVPGGYVWEAPVAATSGPRPVVRLASGPDHVATYLARDTSVAGSRAALERQHARIERALVETRDDRHRPLFVLTESGRMIAYRGDATREDLPAFAARP